MNRKFDPDSFLPLSPLEYQILVCLADRPGHGQSIESTLYKALHRLEAARFISCIETRPGPSPHDARIYALTHTGWLILEQETSRLRQATAIAGTALAKRQRQEQTWAEAVQALEPRS
jgi:DNA-binding MarR family transcriptional regulator